MGEDTHGCGYRRYWGRVNRQQTSWSLAMAAATLLIGSAVSNPANQRQGDQGAGPSEGTHPGYVLNIIADLGSILKQRQNKGKTKRDSRVWPSSTNLVLSIIRDLRYVSTESTTEDSEKRGIDFGLGRGYSGSQAARHMLGLQQASFAGGPGKRKRSGQQEISRGMGPVIIAVPVQEE